MTQKNIYSSKLELCKLRKVKGKSPTSLHNSIIFYTHTIQSYLLYQLLTYSNLHVILYISILYQCLIHRIVNKYSQNVSKSNYLIVCNIDNTYKYGTSTVSHVTITSCIGAQTHQQLPLFSPPTPLVPQKLPHIIEI